MCFVYLCTNGVKTQKKRYTTTGTQPIFTCVPLVYRQKRRNLGGVPNERISKNFATLAAVKPARRLKFEFSVAAILGGSVSMFQCWYKTFKQTINAADLGL